MKEVFEKASVLGVRVDRISQEELIEYILFLVHDRRKAIIANVNVHAVNLAWKLAWFKDFINCSQVVFCDGLGVKWAAKFLNGKVLQRFTPPDWFGCLAEKCAENGLTLFFLGTQQETVEKAAAVLIEKYPGLKIAGVHHGFFDKEPLSPENQAVLARINLAHPDILVVGFGMPLQERWIQDNLAHLDVRVVLPAGAVFDYLSGSVRRAPRWMTDHGLEWLGRLIIEPKRLWKRYLIGNLVFLYRVILQKFGLLKFP